MRLVITGILALIILIMICAFGKRPAENIRTVGNPIPHKKALDYPDFTPVYYFEWKNEHHFSPTIEKAFYLSIHRK